MGQYSKMTTTDPPSEPDGMVDGATGQNDGGREAGDVELAIFRRIRSLSGSTSGLTRRRLLPSAGESFHRYFADPLSMFSAEERNADQSQTPDSSNSGTSTGNSAIPDGESSVEDHSEPTEELRDDAGESLQHYVSYGVAWRDAMVQACADLLGKSLEELQRDYNAVSAAAASSNTAFSPEARSFEPTPRDLADYAIMTTLKVQDAFAMQNATSWLFNMMDRTGAGYVLRDEFVRYAPFIGPVADAAVAGLVFDELVLEQARRAAEDASAAREEDVRQGPNLHGGNRREKIDYARKRARSTVEGLRRRRPSFPGAGDGGSEVCGPSGDGIEDSDNISVSTNGTFSNGSGVHDAPRDLYPPAVALRYDTWRPFFLAIQEKHHYIDVDWVQVKQQLGIDPGELLIKSQGALDHSDVFPTLGKLYLSQRYLIFYAAVGRNHYVARLGAVAEVSTMAIPIMMRDCIKVVLESETQAAMDGVSAPPKKESVETGSTSKKGPHGRETDIRQEPTLSQHVGKLMRQYTAGRKPLLFSLLEFREQKFRDNWVNLTMEMVAAHKLHVQLGFGSSGRAVPSIEVSQSKNPDHSSAMEGVSEEDEVSPETSEIRTLNYACSPFRNEPSPPLLAVAAHANIVRYRSLRRVTRRRVSHSLLLFSHAERNSRLVNWYTDSVRAFQNQSSRTWIERALSAIRENMDTNDRIYQVQDDEPFDVKRLGDAIGRFAELCSPLVRVIQFFNHLFQWRNPPATVLAMLVCIFIAGNGLVHYVPASLVFFQAAWIVETKYNWLGLGMGRTGLEDAERRQANVLALVAQVHDTLAAAQNVLGRMNRELGRVQLLFLWGSEEWQSWAAVGVLCIAGFVLLIVPSRTLFLFFFFFMFFKHFLPPTNPGLKYWQAIPSRIEDQSKRASKASISRKRKMLSKAPAIRLS